MCSSEETFTPSEEEYIDAFVALVEAQEPFLRAKDRVNAVADEHTDVDRLGVMVDEIARRTGRDDQDPIVAALRESFKFIQELEQLKASGALDTFLGAEGPAPAGPLGGFEI